MLQCVFDGIKSSYACSNRIEPINIPIVPHVRTEQLHLTGTNPTVNAGYNVDKVLENNFFLRGQRQTVVVVSVKNSFFQIIFHDVNSSDGFHH